MYFCGRKNVGLEELWTAVDLNHKHITLDTYNWQEETYNNYLIGDYFTNSGVVRYETDLKTPQLQSGAISGEGIERFNQYKFLSDCVKNLKGLIYDSLSLFGLGERENYYSCLHKLAKPTLRGYITFNYDFMLEGSLAKIKEPFRYVNVNDNVNSPNFLLCHNYIVKLHGSLNWEFKHGNPIAFNLESVGVKPTYYTDDTFKEPAIIPPTLFKQEINDEKRTLDPLTQTILQQWRAAIKILSVANKLIFVGYSFPPTDFHARRIFQIAMMRRRSQNKKTKILYCGGGNTDGEEVREKLEDIFGKENEITIKNKFEELCESKELEIFLS